MSRQEDTKVSCRWRELRLRRRARREESPIRLERSSRDLLVQNVVIALIPMTTDSELHGAKQPQKVFSRNRGKVVGIHAPDTSKLTETMPTHCTSGCLDIFQGMCTDENLQACGDAVHLSQQSSVSSHKSRSHRSEGIILQI